LRGPNYNSDPKRVQFCEQISNRLSALPGVSAVGIVSALPLEGGQGAPILVNDQTFDPLIERMGAQVRFATSGYFEAAGISLLRGRTLQSSDGTSGARGVVINRKLADLVWPGQNPIGQNISSNHQRPWLVGKVVGVVENIRQLGPEKEPEPELYITPEAMWGGRTFNLLVRSPQDAARLASTIRHELAAIDPDLPIVRMRTFQTVVDEATVSQRVTAGLINCFMLVALGLVGIGIYGTLSYIVQQRTREIGVRMALGAFPPDILRLVFRQGAIWSAIGIGFGLLGAAALTMLVRSYAYGTAAFMPLPLLAATTVVALSVALACYLPARRATKVNPTEALRAE
jgi:putative ABC transport system permease protein